MNKLFIDTDKNTYLKYEENCNVVYQETFADSKHGENIARGVAKVKFTPNEKLQVWVRVDSTSFMGIRTSMSFAKGLKLGFEEQLEVSLHGYKLENDKIVETSFEPEYITPPNAIANIKDPVIELPRVEIRKGSINDVETLAKLEEELFSREKWSREAIEEAIKREDFIFFVILYNGDMAGASYLSLPHFKDDATEIMSVGIFKKYQGRGYGKKLFNYSVNYLFENGYKLVHLHVRSQNIRAINMYKAAGFDEIHRIPSFYFNPTDTAVVMRKKLENVFQQTSKDAKTELDGNNNSVNNGDIYLGIESSCDETGVAFIQDGQIIASALSSSMEDHQKFGGVIPEIAARKHLEVIDNVMHEAYQQVRSKYPNFKISDISALGVSSAPGLTGALATGVAYAKGLSISLNKPIYGVNHVLAHIMAFGINQKQDNLPKKFLSLIVSGGHTSLVLVDNFKFKELGGTLDDAAGEAFDKVGRLLGLKYPAGPEIDKLAKSGDETKIKFPLPLTAKKFENNHKYDFSFSGLKTAAVRELEQIQKTDNSQNVTLEDFCASFADATAAVLTLKTLLAADEYKCETIVIGGGFSANSQLRKKLGDECQKRGFEFIAPSLKYCTDNGEMIGNLTYLLHQNNATPNQLSFGVHSSYSLESPQCE